MATFGIVAEGVTDQLVIENILLGLCEEEPIVTQVQPPAPTRNTGAGSESPPAGGWTLVLQLLESGEYKDALAFNDFLIVQIDTDVSQDRGFDVPHHDAGRELSVEELVQRTAERLRSLIEPALREEMERRLIFAVSVHQLECWLLPVFHDDNRAAKVTGCEKAVNDALHRDNKLPLSIIGARGKGSKSPRAYRDASKPFMKRRQLLELSARNPSLALFVKAVSERLGGGGT